MTTFFKKKTKLSPALIKTFVKQALKEDVGRKDITTNAFINPTHTVKAVLIAKEAGIIAGIEVVSTVFKTLDKNIQITFFKKDGQSVKKGQKIFKIYGKARAILAGERVALNFLQHLSGVATQTALFVKKIEGTKTRILDTRKTIPGMRLLEKYAVVQGGGYNHRLGLYDMVLVKENHLAISGPSIEHTIKKFRKNNKKITIEVEADSIALVQKLAQLDIDVLMLDNMNSKMLKQAVGIARALNPKITLEASGNVTLATVRKIAQAGVDFISVGSLTHSVKALDMSLLLQ